MADVRRAETTWFMDGVTQAGIGISEETRNKWSSEQWQHANSLLGLHKARLLAIDHTATDLTQLASLASVGAAICRQIIAFAWCTVLVGEEAASIARARARVCVCVCLWLCMSMCGMLFVRMRACGHYIIERSK